MTHFSYIIAIATLIATACMLGVVFYFAAWDFKTIELFAEDGKPLASYTEGNTVSWTGLEIPDKKVERGEVHEYIINYCRYTDAKAQVEKHLVDGILIQLNDLSGGSFKQGCEKGLHLPFLVSDKVPPGEYKLRVRVDYQVSPLQNKVVFFYTETFEVI